ncbi:MAG: hypothetical protein V4858_09075 [Pseudomonadota bacterium]
MSVLGRIGPFLTTAAASPVVADLFSTALWTGTGATKVITTNVDVSAGGAIWIKARSTPTDHSMITTATWSAGDNAVTYPNQTYVRQGYADYVTAIGSSGFTLGSNTVVNASGQTYGGWAFKKAARFFDCGTYTGNGSNRTIAHALTVEPAMVIVKSTTSVGTDWYVYHLDIAIRTYLTYFVKLNSDSFFLNDTTIFNGTRATSSVFSIGTHNGVNQSTVTYEWFAWAHDPASDGVCLAGGYSGNGSGSGPTITLGWEPQLIFIKSIGGNADWVLVDSARGFSGALLSPNLAASEGSTTILTANSTGFTLTTGDTRVNGTSGSYSYLAIRKP